MTIEAFVGEDYFNFGIRVVLINRMAGAFAGARDTVLRLGDNGTSLWEPLPERDDVVLAPTFHLPPDCGRALLQALTVHYNGADDTRLLREDYRRALDRGEKQDAVIADVVKSLALAAQARR